MSSSMLKLPLIFALGLLLAFSAKFGRAQDNTSKPGGSREPIRFERQALVFYSEIQKDLGLTQKQEVQIKRLASTLTQRKGELLFEESGEGTDLEATKTTMNGLPRLWDSQVSKTLTKRQEDRLAQLELQRIGTLALVRKDIATKLKLTPTQNKKIKAILDEAREEIVRSMPSAPTAPVLGQGQSIETVPSGKIGRGSRTRSAEGKGAPGGGAVGSNASAVDGLFPVEDEFFGEGVVSDSPLGNFFFPSAAGELASGKATPAGEKPATGLPELDTPEIRAQLSKMRDVQMKRREGVKKVREGASQKIDAILTKEQKNAWEKMLGKPFDFSKIRFQGGG
ncbi:hypothetical protein [Singulisphaera acidiphila]|uniref:Uncharacterized protein n=1 Tax=Singulisphaera acidiphila (strain ATCC BAA-1392 / DSM 18658 / VKM B-2454 / MOB10) TaxID=886293 RepID=L0DNK2_SINAD|nr:hypothetical protein [Singulisphaera acidiphila]AGA30395.1 hypothetical protein Sinac_6309 [Singulisphaera acidiphila DSM 18658]